MSENEWNRREGELALRAPLGYRGYVHGESRSDLPLCGLWRIRPQCQVSVIGVFVNGSPFVAQTTGKGG